MALLACICLAGCAAPTEKLRVNLVSLEPVEVQLFEQRFDVSLRVQNPNDASYQVSGIDLVLEVNDQSLGTAVSNEAIELPAYGESLIKLSMTSGLFQLMRQVLELNKRGEGALSYRLRGHLKVAGGLGRLPFDNRGELDFSSLGESLTGTLTSSGSPAARTARQAEGSSPAR